MYSYEIVEIKDKDKIFKLIKEVLSDLENPDYYIPYSPEELKNFFNFNDFLTLGVFDKFNDLVGFSQVIVNDTLLLDMKKILGIENFKACEFCGVMVVKKHRGKGIMFHLISLQLNQLRKLGFEYAVIYVHPDNHYSIKNIRNLGFVFCKSCKVMEKYNRQIFIMKL